MEIKLKSGKKIKLKDVSVDERDEMLDSVQYDYTQDGEVLGVKMMHSTMTKWVRIGVDGDTSDEFLKTLSLQDKIEIFTEMQNIYLVGEGKASK
jgi:uncharacterized protein YuzE|tara:strand:+ start:193 stop:474 length:282 start_codon:yes stop_codon:yes gene_type:complete